MKKIFQNITKYFIFFAIIAFAFLGGCNGGPAPVDNPIINYFSVDVNTITEGESATLSWEVTDADSVTISHGIGEVDISGSQTVSPEETTTYILTATNSAGNVTESLIVTVNPVSEEENLTIPTIHSFTSDYTWISPGGSANLSWEVSNADNVSIEPVFGEVNVSGSASVSPSATTTYILTATNNIGENTAEVTIYVFWQPPDWWNGITILPPNIESFSADKSFLTEGITATLSWEVSGIATVSIEPDIGEVENSGTHDVSPTETTTYTLTAGSDTETVTITVEPVKIIQPGPADGKDTWVCSNYKNANNADYGSLLLGRDTGSYSYGVLRSFLQFNLSTIPNNAIITDAELLLYQHHTYDGSDDFSVSAHMITSPWDQYTVTWNNPVPFQSTAENSVTVNAGETTWLSWNIKDLLQGWINGSIDNHGVLLKKINESSGGTNIACWASDYTINPNLRPKLEISYYVP